MKVFVPTFTINIASKPKKEPKPKGRSISRKCLAVVTKVDGEYKAIINYEKNIVEISENYTLKNEVLIIPFTDKSLSLKDKTYVFLKEKDKYNHIVCIQRDYLTANISPGTKKQYDVLKENILISGYIIKKDNKMYFEYEDLISYHYLSENKLCNIDIDETKPLFK